ncbi:hypothetical protein EP10_002178 [Geobacillus icigianus]|uniref:Ketopantoate reductase N-terminal domain-containing protein n=1 Tax=Geobacillus icigianus TaxID=1430331 RepID=A0ABU6BHM4_9BACL|nr:hypothetical protein [Geobacillus icigianus]
MRVLVVGAGAVGGYFGGRLLEKGVDVAFLVRERRKRELEERGLVIRSVHGDAVLRPKLIVAGEDDGPFDVVVFASKAYHLTGAIADAKPYVGEGTMVLPLLNGIAHMESLWAVFGRENVLGGFCFMRNAWLLGDEMGKRRPLGASRSALGQAAVFLEKRVVHGGDVLYS